MKANYTVLCKKTESASKMLLEERMARNKKFLNAKDPTNAGGNKNAEEGDKVNKIGTKKRQRKQK